MPPKVPKPVPLDATACTEIRKEVLRRLLAQYPDQTLVDGSPAFSSAEMCSSYDRTLVLVAFRGGLAGAVAYTSVNLDPRTSIGVLLPTYLGHTIYQALS